MIHLIKKAVPHVIAILSFVLVSVAFYNPAVSGKKLRMGDINQWKGMSKELTDYRNETGEEALWTNSMFGGMPAYQISVADNGNWVQKLDKIYKLGLPRPIDILFKAMLGFYILLMCFRVNPLVGAAGAISFGLSSIFILYLGAGHASKMTSITYIAPLMGGIIYAFRKHALKGALITALFLCFHLAANHLQMTYYAFIMLLLVGISEIVRKVIKGQTSDLVKVCGFLALAGILGVLPNYGSLATTAEYGEYSTRGSSELTIKPDGEQLETTSESGLSKDYILQYSMANGEWFSAYVPNVKGGKTDLLSRNEDASKAIDKRYRDFIAQNNILSYWGEQLSTGGAFYFGAFMFFLAFCAIFLLKDEIKWPLLIVAILAVLASWKLGDAPDFFIDNFPLWDKFRDTKMMLILLMIIVPLLGTLFLNQFLTNAELRTKQKNFFFIVSGAFLVINVILLTSPGAVFSFINSAETEAFSPLKESPEGKKALNSIVKGRQAIFKADLTRSLVIFLLGAVLLCLAIFKRETAKYLAYGLGLIFLVDMWSVNSRYYSPKSDFVSARNDVPFKPEAPDLSILEREKVAINEFSKSVTNAKNVHAETYGKTKGGQTQRELEALQQNSHFRVLNLGNPWSDARTSFFHKSLGGYHGAKLKVYSELIEFQLGDEVQKLISELGAGRIAGNYPGLSMLNTKYLIGNMDAPAIPFENGLGAAWLVNGVVKVASADDEITALATFPVDSLALVQSKYADGLSSNYSAEGSIDLIAYHPNHLVYEVSTSEKALAVFSEIYYPAGWNAYVDGQPVSHFKTDYVLRGLELPAGTKKVEFKFEPSTYTTGKAISTASSLILMLLLLGMFGLEIKKALGREVEPSAES